MIGTVNTPKLILSPAAILEDELAAALERAKEPDALAPVTILVGNTLLRPYLQRRLAEITGGHVNVQIQTFTGLSLNLGEHAMLARGRSLLPPLASRVLAQQVARGATRYFKPVAGSPGFAQALRRLIGELREAGIDPQALAKAAKDTGNPDKVADAAALYTSHEKKRSRFYDAKDCMLAANAGLFDSVALLVYGVWQTSAAQRALLEKLIEKVPTTFFLPRTQTEGDSVYTDLHQWLTGLGAEQPELNAPDPQSTAIGHLKLNLFSQDGPAPEDGTALLVSAPDPPREVVEAARACLRWAREGIAFHEMAITYRHSRRFRPLIESVFADAGIPVYVHEGTPLTERPLGRRVVALLELVDSGLPRAAVMEFLTDAELPVATRERHPQFDSAAWDSITRIAGAVEGREQLTARPLAFFEQETERLARYKRKPPPWGKDVEPLTEFINELADHLEAHPVEATWSEHVTYLSELCETYISGVEPIVAELRMLAQLDSVSTKIKFEHFRTVALQAMKEMRSDEESAPQSLPATNGTGTAPHEPNANRNAFARCGVNVLDVNSMRHLSFRAVAILGLTERAFPPPARQDALLLDSERLALNGSRDWAIPVRTAGMDPEQLQFTLAVHAARERIQLSFARTETGNASPHLPSHFFRAAATALAGSAIGVEDMDPVPAGLRHRSPGNRFAAPALEKAIDANDYDRTLVAGPDTRALGIACIERLKPAVTAAIAAREARWRDSSLTAYDGVFTEKAHSALKREASLDRPISATTLEAYAQCPYRYFLAHVLHLDRIEEPENIHCITPMDRGSLVHEVLERFMHERVEANDPPCDDRRAIHTERLSEIAAEVGSSFESRGLTGLATLWALDRRSIFEDLELWYDSECASPQCFDNGKFEEQFGFKEPFEITADGVTLKFRGLIDRLEWSGAAGEADATFRVIDYKTGGVQKTHADGSLTGGRSLQLPIYMLAAAKQLGIPPKRGEAQYFFISTRGGFERVKFTGEDLEDRDDDFHRLLASFATGIANGDFHPVPGRNKKNCAWCDFDSICDAQRVQIFERKAEDPRATAFAGLGEIK